MGRVGLSINTFEDDRMIAVFMGANPSAISKKVDAKSGGEWAVWSFEVPTGIMHDVLDYSTNWARLMPVVQAIYNEQESDLRYQVEEFIAIKEALSTGEISAAYRAVVEYLHWLNE